MSLTSAMMPVAGALFLAVCGFSHAQLAITEVMSDGSTNASGNYPDFWELTNFGTNALDLNGYKFYDRGSFESARSEAFQGLVIQPGESIIFCRETPGIFTNESQFRDWWGATKLEGVRVVVVGRLFFPGLGSPDAIQLWDANGNLVDRVDFADPTPGYTFTYSRLNGDFPIISEAETCHAWVASGSGLDIGSPGRTCGPVDLQISQQPVDLEIDAGGIASFTARAIGFPRPRCQWFFNDKIIPGANTLMLSLTNVTPEQAGGYHLVVTNGINLATSRVATLTVNTNERPCEIINPPRDLTVTLEQTATFSIVTRGYPLNAYSWFHNGIEIGGATESILQIGGVNFSSAGTYSVVASNGLGTCTASATLVVTRKPFLAITEIMAEPSLGQADWWELTNVDTNDVQVLGYRFDDKDGTFGGAFTIAASVTLAPGESMIFVEEVSPEAFRQWWSPENLPPHLKIVTFRGFGFSQTDDELTLWNPTASEVRDSIDQITYAWAPTNVTYRFASEQTIREAEPSVEGEHGAFRAAQGGDIGSPGYTTNPPPRITAIQHNGAATIVRWKAQPGQSYRIESNTLLANGAWSMVGTFIATNQIMTAIHSSTGNQRFYRVRREP